jgi:hypothetical protein
MQTAAGKKNRLKGAKIAIVALAVATTAYANASGPPASRSGAPGESTCTQCHVGAPLNSGPGSITIEGVPENYTPGEEIALTVRVEHPQRTRWGFQLTALDGSNRPAGTFVLVNRNLTRTVNGAGQNAGRVYVEHTSGGTFANQPQGAEWQVTWVAPANDVGRVTFYAAGNAANNNNQSSGDNVYTTSVGTGMSTPTIIAPTYKKGKIVLQVNGSNIEEGAELDVTRDGVPEAETFPLSLNKRGTKWVVKKAARSTPSGLSVDDVLPAGATVTIVVRNPDSTTSAPAELSR